MPGRSTVNLRADNRVKYLYDAENHELPNLGSFASIDEAQKKCVYITTTAEWASYGNWPRIVQVVSNAPRQYSWADWPNTIWLAPNHLNLQVLLHELAHLSVPVGTDHKPEFVRRYLQLIDTFAGRHYYTLYHNAFKRRGIKF